MSHPIAANAVAATLLALADPGVTVDDVAAINADIAVNAASTNAVVAANTVAAASACTTNAASTNVVATYVDAANTVTTNVVATNVDVANAVAAGAVATKVVAINAVDSMTLLRPTPKLLQEYILQRIYPGKLDRIYYPVL